MNRCDRYKKNIKNNKHKTFKIIGIVLLVFIIYNLVDLAQAYIFNNTPIISYKITYYETTKSKVKAGLLFNTYVYCNNEKIVKLPWRSYLLSYYPKGCEGEMAEEYIKERFDKLDPIDDYIGMPDYNYVVSLTGAIPTIESLYYNKKLSDKQAIISIDMIQDIAQCDKKYKLDSWNSTEEFYDIWKDSKCRKKYMKKHKFN